MPVIRGGSVISAKLLATSIRRWMASGCARRILHNGSVPTLRDLLNSSAERPAVFYRGYDVFEPVKVGFVSDVKPVHARGTQQR